MTKKDNIPSAKHNIFKEGTLLTLQGILFLCYLVPKSAVVLLYSNAIIPSIQLTPTSRSPITVQSDPSHTSTTSMSRKKTINIRDLFVEPNFHELEAVATDSKGEPRRLSQDQLESIRQTGRFQVQTQIEGSRYRHR